MNTRKYNYSSVLNKKVGALNSERPLSAKVELQLLLYEQYFAKTHITD